MLKRLSLAAAMVVFAATLSAQTPYPDTFKVTYYSNANVGGYLDGTVRITNVGTQVASKTDPSGNLCAMVYVFDPNQELAECCGCPITPDGLATLSVNGDLTDSPLTSVTLRSGDIKIVSSTGYPGCNPTKPVPTIGVRAWGTHIQNGDSRTETEFADSSLSAAELTRLTRECSAIRLVGSGLGICTCGNSITD